ncbi:carbohydrate porin [Gimesia fumaroli]|uniref:Porin B n=1 Tax=Gimesia fumaroli TaxID=2527976 RepID=A0A518IC21_9PLAN|nr:carbohydrate porin [Gimesia fumaroli]QDV50647.1 Porin B precursor [Gimesia fumaroli]
MWLKDFVPILILLLALPSHQTVGEETADEGAGEPPANARPEVIPPDQFKPDQLPVADLHVAQPDNRLLSPWLNKDNGVTVTPIYYGELFTNAHGGIATNGSTQYEGLLDLSLDFDFEKMDLAIPGRAALLFQNTHGRGLDQFVGATQLISSIDSYDNITQISELWWELDFFDEAVTFRIGRQDISTEFITMETAGDFINSAFGLSPSAGLPSFPAPSPALIMMTDLSDSITFKAGLWDAYRSNERGIFSQNGSVLYIAEFEYRYTTARNGLPGKFSAGVTYETPGEVPAGAIPRSFGYYLQIEQMLYREADSTDDNPQGLSVFAQHYPTETNGNSPFPEIPQDGLAGFAYTGLLRGRDEDVIGAGIGWVELNQGGTDEELMVEVFYKAQINDNLSIQPDLQYINTPSGLYPSALAAGIRFQLDL